MLSNAQVQLRAIDCMGASIAGSFRKADWRSSLFINTRARLLQRSLDGEAQQFQMLSL
jgi:hypothetical protein